MSVHFLFVKQKTAYEMRSSDWSSDVFSSDLYNGPGRTGCDMLPETVAELAAHERIVGIKEARNDAERMQALLPLRGDGFAVLSGDDPTAVRAMLAGADGIVSVASNVVPSAFRRLADLARAGQEADAQALDARLDRKSTSLNSSH